MSQVTRRQFIAAAAALSATPVWASPKSTRSRVTSNERRDLYPEGVASGDPQPDSVFSSGEDIIYSPNATGFNLQMAKHKAAANVTHAR